MFCAALSGKDALWLRYKSKDNFFACCARTSLSTESRIYRQIESFAGTPFASALGPYAVESYQSLYLKCITRRVYGGSYQQPRRIL
jgi:hypothetical protein